MSSVDHHLTPQNIRCILHNQHLLQMCIRIKTRTRLIGSSLRLHKVSVVKKVTTGTAGSAGKKGDKGDKGHRGDKGDKGDKGDAGAKGASGASRKTGLERRYW